MSTRPTAEEAARSLRDIDRRADQALELMVARRWVYVVFGIAIFLYLASSDFLSKDVSTWANIGLTVLVVANFGFMRTRRGAEVLGRPVQHQSSVISRKARVIGTLLIVAIVVASTVIGLTGVLAPVHLPYWRTALGTVLAVALIGFGPQIQRALNSAYKRTPGPAQGKADGRR